MSNLILLILLPVHGRRKSARRVGFPFVTALSSLPGNTLHSNHKLIVNPGIVAEPVLPIALLAFSGTHEHHLSLDLDNEQRPQRAGRHFCFDTASLTHGGPFVSVRAPDVI